MHAPSGAVGCARRGLWRLTQAESEEREIGLTSHANRLNKAEGALSRGNALCCQLSTQRGQLDAQKIRRTRADTSACCLAPLRERRGGAVRGAAPCEAMWVCGLRGLSEQCRRRRADFCAWRARVSGTRDFRQLCVPDVDGAEAHMQRDPASSSSRCQHGGCPDACRRAHPLLYLPDPRARFLLLAPFTAPAASRVSPSLFENTHTHTHAPTRLALRCLSHRRSSHPVESIPSALAPTSLDLNPPSVSP